MSLARETHEFQNLIRQDPKALIPYMEKMLAALDDSNVMWTDYLTGEKLDCGVMVNPSCRESINEAI